MKIESVTCRYGELVSTGYPTFSNKRVEMELSARLETGDTVNSVRERLMRVLRASVAAELIQPQTTIQPPTKEPVDADVPF